MMALLPQEGCRSWTLTTLKDKLIKVGARVIKHARYTVFQMAEVCVGPKAFNQILRNIMKLAPNTS